MPLCLPLKTTAQEMKTKKSACPDLIWTEMWPGNPWLTAVPGGSNSPEGWANGMCKKEQQGGKRARAAELWLQPPCKCFSQQAISLRNFRQNMSRIHLSSLYSTCSLQHPHCGQLRHNPTQAKCTSTVIYKHHYKQKPCRLKGLCPWAVQLHCNCNTLYQ